MKYKHCCFLDEVNSSSHVAVLRVCERVVNSVAYIIVIIISWSATRKWSAQVSSLSLFPSHLSYTSASITCLSRVNCCYYYWQAPPQLVFLPSLCPIFVSPLSACLSLFSFGHPGSAGFTIWALLNSVKPFHQFFSIITPYSMCWITCWRCISEFFHRASEGRILRKRNLSVGTTAIFRLQSTRSASNCKPARIQITKGWFKWNFLILTALCLLQYSDDLTLLDCSLSAPSWTDSESNMSLVANNKANRYVLSSHP